jgi:hypothetical protein
MGRLMSKVGVQIESWDEVFNSLNGGIADAEGMAEERKKECTS